MPVEYIGKQLRRYKVTCDKCGDDHLLLAKDKNELRNNIRKYDWIWRDLGILGIVECVCPECAKKGK